MGGKSAGRRQSSGFSATKAKAAQKTLDAAKAKATVKATAKATAMAKAKSKEAATASATVAVGETKALNKLKTALRKANAQTGGSNTNSDAAVQKLSVALGRANAVVKGKGPPGGGGK